MTKGTWGRRIGGKISKTEDFTWFLLELETSEGETLVIEKVLPSRTLRLYPALYKAALDRMVEELEAKLQSRSLYTS